MNDSGALHATAENLTLSGDLTIFNITDIKARLMDTLDAHETVLISFREITGVDLAGLQLLCSAHRSAAAAGKNLRLSQPLPECLLQTARAAGYARSAGCSFSLKTNCLFNEGGN